MLQRRLDSQRNIKELSLSIYQVIWKRTNDWSLSRVRGEHCLIVMLMTSSKWFYTQTRRKQAHTHKGSWHVKFLIRESSFANYRVKRLTRRWSCPSLRCLPWQWLFLVQVCTRHHVTFIHVALCLYAYAILPNVFSLTRKNAMI